MVAARFCIVVRGSREETLDAVQSALARLESEHVLWVSRSDRIERATHAASARSQLGRSFDAVVLDLHDGIDADAIGQCHGLVWRGGRLVFRMPTVPVPSHELAVHPFTRADVGTLFFERFERCLAASDALAPLAAIDSAARETRGTREQAALVETLADAFASDEPAVFAVLADRGRGKSSALGLALSRAAQNAAVTAASEDAAFEVLRFAGERARFVAPIDLVRSNDAWHVIVVDEAAQLPIPILQAIVRRHPRARIAFASTVHGYEGTGRGFALRFLPWAERERALSVHSLEVPIRYDAGDPVERLVFDALLLDAEPAQGVQGIGSEKIEYRAYDRAALAADERTLREIFGLLVHAHYRTTPSDLHRMLDAPNLAVHALSCDRRVVAASIVAHEGALSLEHSEALARGAMRIRGHALADTLVCHSDRPDAGVLSMLRSVRIAVHPDLRRRGLAHILVEHIHAAYSPDLFGTLFGATPELLRFRRSVGYELVRVGVSRGVRTGEPAAVMVRAVSERARSLVSSLRIDLARNLPLQLELLAADGELSLEAGLADALAEDLPDAPPLSEEEVRASVRSYLTGPRPYESAAFAISRFASTHRDRLCALDPRSRALIEGRVLGKWSWSDVAKAAGFPSVPSAMRALRPALRALAREIDHALSAD